MLVALHATNVDCGAAKDRVGGVGAELGRLQTGGGGEDDGRCDGRVDRIQ